MMQMGTDNTPSRLHENAGREATNLTGRFAISSTLAIGKADDRPAKANMEGIDVNETIECFVNEADAFADRTGNCSIWFGNGRTYAGTSVV